MKWFLGIIGFLAILTFGLFFIYWNPAKPTSSLLGVIVGAFGSAVFLFGITRFRITRKLRFDETWTGYPVVAVAGTIGGVIFALLTESRILLSILVWSASITAVLLIERCFGSKDYRFSDDE
jgi:ammonia channel protein AmtB